MPAKKSPDPLKLVSLRVPRSALETLESGLPDGMTLSDGLRSRLNLDGVVPLENPKPRKRLTAIEGGVSRADPMLIRQLAALGSNLNQIARAVNKQVAGGTEVPCIKLLVAMASIDKQLMVIAKSAEAKAKPKA